MQAITKLLIETANTVADLEESFDLDRATRLCELAVGQGSEIEEAFEEAADKFETTLEDFRRVIRLIESRVS